MLSCGCVLVWLSHWKFLWTSSILRRSDLSSTVGFSSESGNSSSVIMDNSPEDAETDSPLVLALPAALKGWVLAFLAGVICTGLCVWWMSRPETVQAFVVDRTIDSPEAATSVFQNWLISTEGKLAVEQYNPVLLSQEATELTADSWLIPCIDQVQSHKHYFFVSPGKIGPMTHEHLRHLLSERYPTADSDLIRDEMIPLSLELLHPNARLIGSADEIPNHSPRNQGRTFVGRLDEDLMTLIKPISFRQASQTRTRYYVAYAWGPVNGEVLRLRMEFNSDNSDPDPEEGWRITAVDCRSLASRIGGQPGMQSTP